ncbi:lipocalin family protein [Mycolicibacterium sp. P1-18]|uniref:lipocalin family protein n=1 Tax=Mycolicibacterium sp. P1-18 TaxID=2024615 RepID=UPI001F5B0494|nr:lipocalin family protein [Mycolicibacterium sp. P1-18]
MSASTVTVDRDDPVVKSKPTKTNTKSAEGAAASAAVTASTPLEVTPKDPTPKDPTPKDPVVAETTPVADTIPVAETTPAVESTPPVVAEEKAEPVVVPTPSAGATPPSAVEPAALAAADVSTIRSLAAPVAPRPQPGPIATVVISLLSAFGLLPPVAPVPVDVTGVPTQSVPGTSNVNGVTGVQVGSSNLGIPVGAGTYTGAADWYFPTQADGTVQAQGVMLLQHGFLGSKSWYAALAQDLAVRTNSIVVVPNIPSFPFFTCNGCTLSAVPMQQGVAALFTDPNRTSLNASAAAAGFHGVLPEKFILTGHSAGGGLAAAAGGFYSDAVAPADNDLLGVVMYDGVSSNGTFAGALTSLANRGIPIYQIAAPPQPWNANGQTTNDLVAAQQPGQFVGVVLANGSHVDSLIGGSPIIDFFSQLFIKPSPPGNTQAVYTLANGWINDMYAGLGPANGVYGTYGDPDQYLELAPTAAIVLGPAPVVDVNRYLGTWYEVGSVKQFFSFGLVNTTAVYSANPDGSIGVVNSGNYFVDGGPQSRIVGAALPVSATNDKLNVTFFGPASATPPGNYWIVDLAADYGWAIVSDPSGNTGFLLSRTRTVSADLYQELLDRASVKGVKGRITVTPQPAAARELSSPNRV